MAGKLLALPVFPFWIRVNPFSRHEALFQSTGAYVKDQMHVETSLVQGPVPMFQKFTGSVWGDMSRMGQQGHDHGPLALHLVLGPPDNGLLPMTILCSSCKWPVTAQRRLHKDRSLCAFFPAYAPYLYCSAEQEDDLEPDRVSKAHKVADKGIKKLQGAGLGNVLIPTGSCTVLLTLNWTDLVLGAYHVIESKALGMLSKKLWTRWGGGIDARSYLGFTNQAAWRYARAKLLRKWGTDTTTSLLRATLKMKGWKVGLPFQLASWTIGQGKWQMWTYEYVWQPTNTLRPVELVPEPPEAREPPEPKPAPADPPRYFADPAEREFRFWTDPAKEPEPNSESEDLWLDPFAHPPPSPYNPQARLLEELLEGAPHAL